MALRAIAFDLDGTLYPYRHLAISAAAFALSDLARSRHFFRVRRLLRKARPVEDFRLKQAELFAEATGMPPEDAKAWIDRRIYGDWVRSFHALSPYPGVSEFLDAAARRGLDLAVLSDYPVAEKLGYLGLSGAFPVALCSEESGYLKPNPEAFAMLCARLGHAPSEILYVGDSYEYDIVGARAAGLRTAHLSRRGGAAGVADLRFSRYSDLERRLVELALLDRGRGAGPSITRRN
jgi:putative hydrolase of the HAD superfamily